MRDVELAGDLGGAHSAPVSSDRIRSRSGCATARREETSSAMTRPLVLPNESWGVLLRAVAAVNPSGLPD